MTVKTWRLGILILSVWLAGACQQPNPHTRPDRRRGGRAGASPGDAEPFPHAGPQPDADHRPLAHRGALTDPGAHRDRHALVRSPMRRPVDPGAQRSLQHMSGRGLSPPPSGGQ